MYFINLGRCIVLCAPLPPKMLLIGFSVFLSIFTLAGSVCPAGWAQRLNNCYFIFSDKLNKSESALLCEVHSATLVTFSDQDEWMYITNLTKSVQLDIGAWTLLTYDNSKKWAWPDQTTAYTELYHWQAGSGSAGSSPNFVPTPDADHIQAKIISNGSDTFLQVELASTFLHPFCKRDIDSRDLCDTNENWVNILHGCYKIYPASIWQDAIKTCSDGGGELLSPTSETELQPLIYLTEDNVSLWIGAYTSDSSKYFFINGKTTDYLPWLPVGSNQGDASKQCVGARHVNSSAGYFMSACYAEMKFICRKPVGTCPLGWYQDGLYCFKLHIRPEERMTWYMAVDYCKTQGAMMVEVVQTEKAKVMLNKALQENDVNLAWIGFSGSQGSFHYLSDINSVISNPVLFDTTSQDLRCGVTHFPPDKDVFLGDYCFTLRPFVCSIEITDTFKTTSLSTTSCDAFWIPFNNDCYNINTTATTYANAVSSCKSQNAILFTASDQILQSFFSTQPLMLKGLDTYWIGLKYNAISKTYLIEETQQVISWLNFDVNQILIATNGSCVYVEAGSTATFAGSWFNEDCDGQHSFACRKTGKQGPPKPSLTTGWTSECGAGWLYSSVTNFCYFISPYVQKPWQEARLDCQAKEGNLLSVYGPEEQAFIEDQLKSDLFTELEEPLWIGSKDLWEGQGWGWSDGQPFRYLNWGNGQPHYDSDDGDNCGHIPVSRNFEWETRPCGDQLGFICKKEASKPPDTTQVPPPVSSGQGQCEPESLISGDYSIQFPQDFTASSYKDDFHQPEYSRMVPFNNVSWSPANNSIGEWLAVTFPTPVSIMNLQMKGEDSTDSYVSKFKFQYQYDSMSPWYWLTDNVGNVEILDGVTGPDVSTSLLLPGEIQAHAIKIWPVEWSFGIAIQMELVGCHNDDCPYQYVVSGPIILADGMVKASSEDINFEVVNARLKSVQYGMRLSYWMPDAADKDPWIQVDLGQNRIVRGIVVEGGYDGNYVTNFELLFSRGDGNTDSFITYTEPYGVKKVFEMSNPMMNIFLLKSSIVARVVRFHITAWHKKAAFKFDVLACSTGCQAQPSIMDKLPISSLTASDSDPNHMPSRSVLNTVRNENLGDSWQPLYPTSMDDSYLQVDLGTTKQVTAVATQGSYMEDSWLESYFLAFSNDGQTFRRYGSNVSYFIEDKLYYMFADSVIWGANFDGNSVVMNELFPPINARYVQLWPHEFHKAIAVRWEVYTCSKHSAATPVGCYADDTSDPDLPYVPTRDRYASTWPDGCLSTCYDKGYRYAGLQYGDYCSCGNEYGLYGPAQNCSMPCQDPYFNFTCGGLNNNAVYSTGIGATSMICPAGWIPYNDSCYAKFDEGTWIDSRDGCLFVGAHLADIAEKGENAVVASLIGENVKGAWIGLNDFDASLNFEWSTKAMLQFTNWGLHQPVVNPGLDQHGVLISKDGSWSNVFGDTIHAYICELPKTPSADPAADNVDKGCLKGWKASETKCYQFNRQKNIWKDAQKLCQLEKATLAHIESGKENVFLMALLAQLDGNYWTDVLDKNSVGLYQHNSSDADLEYASWAKQKPDSAGQCVSIGTSVHAGEWTNEPCDSINRFVCEQPRTGAATKPPPTTKPDLPCPNGWKYFNNGFCYQFNVNSSTNPSLSWHEANENCKQQGAQLASFHSDTDFSALTGQLKDLGQNNFWIGLNNLDSSGGFEWSDGSVMNFIKWGNGQPQLYQPLFVCGEILMDSLTMGLQDCYQLKNWICAVEHGKQVTVIRALIYPMPESAGACKPLSDDWHKYRDYCYYIANGAGGTDDSLTWKEARQFCGLKGADLTSIGSMDVNLMLQGMLQGQNVDAVWIGLNELERSKGYSWSDKTPVGQWGLNWNVNEPNDYYGFEACVELLTRNGKWNDEHCSTRQGFVCKQVAPGVNISIPTPVPRPDGNCPSGFDQLDKKCYKIMGTSTQLTWFQAQLSCRNMLAAKYPNYTLDLASITSEVENAFVTTLVKSANKQPVWIGLRQLASGPYAWADNEDLSYENWNRNEPNMASGNDTCVYMYGANLLAGKWNDVACEEEAAYVCQGFVDPKIPSSGVIPPSSKCDTSQGFQLFGNSCLKLFNQSATWRQAKAICINVGAHLTSIQDSYDWAKMYLMVYTFESGVWIGLNDILITGTYLWDIGYPVTFTRWAQRQPLDQINWGCVYMDQMGLFNNGLCTDVRPFICRKDIQPPDIVPNPIGNYCRSKSFYEQNNMCYLLVLNKNFTYEEAGQDCVKMGATLTSLHDPTLVFNIPNYQNVWIGLRESITDGFSWEDGSPLYFTKWASNEPRWLGLTDPEGGCVAMVNGKWYNRDCENKYGYICAAPTGEDTTELTLPPINVTELIPTPAIEVTPTTRKQQIPPSPTTGTTNVLTTVTATTATTTNRASFGSKPSASPTVHITSTVSFDHSQSTTYQAASHDSAGLSGGDVAGIVIGVLLFIALAVIIFIYLRRRGALRNSFLRQEASRIKNFENSLYEATRKDDLTRSDDREGISIDIIAGRVYSVSYSPQYFNEPGDLHETDLEILA